MAISTLASLSSETRRDVTFDRETGLRVVTGQVRQRHES